MLQLRGLGTFMVGPALVIWYKTLSVVVKGSGKSVVLKKVGLDQLCFSPTFIGCFLCALGFAQGKDFQQIRKDISRDYQDILLTNYKIWPLVQLGNFYLTPLQYQTLVVQAVAICWNTYISWKTQLRQQDKIEK
ncbi:protein Mpv17-like isoform X3 [Coccinella septempunctata]|uniref:protein Mpv17-like isoform X3 n=1 Tax=Coccinella septempunctata TaxID=41139 RepID=UPI001D0857B6|nr:protein Mpv17-like isoform X3 [Coccinella septempunctata]